LQPIAKNFSVFAGFDLFLTDYYEKNIQKS